MSSTSVPKRHRRLAIPTTLLALAGVVCFANITTPANAQVSQASGTGSVLFPATAVGSSSVPVIASLKLSAAQSITSISAVPSQANKTEFTVGAVTGCAVDGSTSNATGTVCTVSITFTPSYTGRRNVPLKLVTSTGTWYVGLSGVANGPQVVLTPGTINTAAGTGTFVDAGFSGDNGPATSAHLNQPYSIKTDSAGNVYFSDGLNYRIRRISAATGVITTVAGNGSSSFGADGVLATSTGMFPKGIALDAAGNLYIADYDNYRVRKVDATTGIITTVAGNGLEYDGLHNTGDAGPATAAYMLPLDIAVDPTGNLYIADCARNSSSSPNYRIRKVDAATGIIQTVAGTGSYGSSGDGGLATAAKLWPTTVSLDPYGNIYTTDAASYTVRRIDAVSGIITTVAGNGLRESNGDGGPATSASIDSSGVVADAAGNIYIADNFRGGIRFVDAATKTIHTIAGEKGVDASGDGGSATDAGTSVRGMAVDSLSNLWIVDYYNSRIRTVDVHNVALAYQSTAVGSTSSDSPKTAFLSNTGNAPLHVATPSSGSNPAITAGFALNSTDATACPLIATSASPGTLAAGALCTLPISFIPVTSGTITGTLNITDDNLNQPATVQTITLSGTATGGPAGTLSVSVSAASIVAGTSSTNLTAAITYSASAPTGAVNIRIDSGSAVAASCAAATGVLSCQATYPTASLTAGTHTITASIASDTTYNATSGSGTLTVTASTPKAVLSPANGSFGSVTVGTTSAAQAFTLASGGNTDLTISAISLSGANASSFHIASSTCGSSLSPGHSCEVDVTFAPTASGNASATLSVMDNAGTQSATLDGAGTVTAAPQADLSPTTLSFGSVTVGSTSASQTATLKNAGNAVLPISSISIVGTNASFFVISNNTCGSTLSAGGTCIIGITFKPSTAGNAIAALSIVDSVGTQTSTVSGTGVAVVAADFSVATTPSQQTVSRGSTATFTIQLVSAASGSPFTSPVTLSASGLPTGATATFSPSNVVPGASQPSTSTMTVTVPTATASLDRSDYWPLGTLPTASLGCVLLLWPVRRKRRPFSLLLVVVASLACVGLVACGGGATVGPSDSTSTIVVTASSGGTTHTTTIALTVH